jgi:diguanylate cyclase (GGDEF)-like protein
MMTPALTSNLRNRLIMSIGALLVLVGVAGYFVVIKSQHNVIEQQALTVAKIVTKHANASRSIYSNNVVQKIKADGAGFVDIDFHSKVGGIPLPAQFLKNVAQKASDDSDGLYEYRAVSKWNLAPGQSLDNEFLRTAWSKLEKQDLAKNNQAINWQSSHTITTKDGNETLMYLAADPATSESCIGCHNAYENTPEIIQRRIEQGLTPGKQWQKNQLLGAFYVQIPLNGIRSIAVKESTQSIILIVMILTGGLIILAFLLLSDVSKANKITQKLFWQARHDDLTQLPNRMQFEERVSTLVADAKNTSNRHYLCFLDLDHFKIVNDTCGHTAGDKLLSEITVALRKTIGEKGMLARLGGDQFGILLENESLDGARKLSDQLRQNVKDYDFVWNDQVFDIGACIGLVEINEMSTNCEQVINNADLACYAAKDAGRNRIQVYVESDEDIAFKAAEVTWVSKVLAALEEDRLLIYSQAITSTSPDSNHSHFEILCRLREENNTIAMPSQFMPAAERYNLMTKLDAYVIEKTFIALNQNCFKDLGDTGFISINLAGQSLSDEGFLEQVTQLMDHHNVDAHKICFEITETSTIKSPKVVINFMKSLKKRGVRFALDDFGTGLSSLTYLKQFPVDYLKIDGSFIRDITSNPIDRKLVDAINNLSRTLNIKTVAEFVDSEETLSLLSNMGIDYVQGFFINKPQAVI